MAKIITKFKGDNKDFKGRKKEIEFLKTDEIKQISRFSQTEILEHFNLENFGLDYDEAKDRHIFFPSLLLHHNLAQNF